MSICNSYTIQTISLDECVGTSLLTINNNFRNLNEQTCTDYTNLTDIRTEATTLSTNIATLSALSPGCAKAWVAFDGDSGNTGSGARFPTTFFNVASISSLAIGKYRINFATSFLSGNYALIGTCRQTSSHTWVQPTTAFEPTYVDINIRNSAGTLQDSDYISILIYNI